MSVKLRWKSLKSGDKSAYLDIYHNGERNYEFLNIRLSKNDDPNGKKETKLLAESIRLKREMALQANDYEFTPSFNKKVDFLLYCKTYLDKYNKKDKKKLKYALEKFQSFIGKDTLQANKVTVKLCSEYKEYLNSPEAGLTGETPYGYWKLFKKVVKKAVIDGLFTKNPTESIKFNGSQKFNVQLRKNVLTETELQTLAKTYCGNEEIKRAFLFTCFTGLGAAEIRKLTWSRINNGKIKIFREKNGEQVINDLHPVAVEILGKKGKPDATIFSLPSDVAIGKTLKAWVKKAGIEKRITFYSGRHTFATLLLMNGANLKTVADCMGHTSTKHTLKYLNYVDSLKTKAINSLPSIEL